VEEASTASGADWKPSASRTLPMRGGSLTDSQEVVILSGQMKTIAITEFKAHCLALLEDIARTGESLLVTKRGKALARVVPSIDGGSLYPQASLAGTVTIVGDVVDPVLPASAWSAMRGQLLATPEGRKRSKKPPRGARK
jgi:antitoxin (DNA-binding transcriptional repressor) of toxin-antitoxin stability system